MEAGYEPNRIHHLTRRTLEAIDTLGALASSDPAAADAMRHLEGGHARGKVVVTV